MSQESFMICRVRDISTRNNRYDLPPRLHGKQFILFQRNPPHARNAAMKTARKASISSRNAVFFAETLSDEKTWINKAVWFRGYEYEIVGDTIPGFPLRHLITFILEA